MTSYHLADGEMEHSCRGRDVYQQATYHWNNMLKGDPEEKQQHI